MTINASVVLEKNEFVADLSDGRQIRQSGVREIASALHRAGVLAQNAQCEWRAGHRMLTAGQQVALNAEMRRLEHLLPGIPMAA
jgi:DNA-binding IclR family transcriptional regulator